MQARTLQSAPVMSAEGTIRRNTAMPCAENDFLSPHIAWLVDSLRHWTGRDLVAADLPRGEQARQLFHAPFALLSHDGALDPLLNYGNLAGMRLFELSWSELMATPSRLTAAAADRDERARLLASVAARGFIDDYRGMRVSKSGRRFIIENATVWNLLDEDGAPCGQAAMFADWRFLDGAIA
jgi:hypothetical protein